MTIRIHEAETVAIADLRPYPRNARRHSEAQLRSLEAIIREAGFTVPLVIDESREIIAGHGRLEAAKRLGMSELPAVVARGLSESQKKALRIADNQMALLGEWDFDLLRGELRLLGEAGFDLGLTGFGDFDLSDSPKPGQASGALAERFGIAPFSVLNAREGWWQARKAAWLALGIRSEIGRGDNLLRMSETILEPDPSKRAKKNGVQTGSLEGGLTLGVSPGAYDRRAGQPLKRPGSRANAKVAGGGGGGWAAFNAARAERLGYEEAGAGTSIFDPVLAELLIRWFCPPSGSILDPFAGGSVRGIVSGWLGRPYLGIDLSDRQVEANREQGEAIFSPRPSSPRPAWTIGDAAEAELAGPHDFILSCPPYGDLERYSDDPRDLSTMAYPAFVEALGLIVARAAEALRPNRFAAFVVGDIREPSGAYRSFPAATIEAFEAAGLRLYNDAILVTAASSLPIRAGRQFERSRKLGTTHQRILVFLKGDSKKAVEALGEVEFGEIGSGSPSPAPPADEPGLDSGGLLSQPSAYGERLLGLGGQID